MRRSYGRCVSRHSRSIKFAVIRTVADDLTGGKRARMTAGPRKPPFTPRWLQRPEWVVLRRSPVTNVLYFPFFEAPPITVGGRRKGPVGRRPRCRASRYRVRCRADPVADRSRASHDGGAKNAGHVPLHDVGQITDALYALLGGAVFVWARSAPRWWRRSCRPSPSRGASVKSRASAVHWPCIRSRRDGSTGSTVIAVRCSSRACRTLCRSTSPPRCSTLCCCRWLQDS